MKHIKKLLAFAVVAVMMLSLCSFGAYAATITVNTSEDSESEVAETFVAYKIFDVTKAAGVTEPTTTDGNIGPGTAKGYSYTIQANSPWLSVVQNNLADYFTLSASTDGTWYSVVLKNPETNNTEAVAKTIAGILLANKPASAPSVSLTAGTAATVDDGYYLITSSFGTNLVLATSNITITSKNQSIVDDKVAETASVTIGENATFYIKVFLPENIDTTLPVVVHDAMAPEFKFNNDVQVAVLDADPGTTAASYKAIDTYGALPSAFVVSSGDSVTDGCTFHITLTTTDYAGKYLVFKYSAELTSAADADGDGYVNKEFASTGDYTTVPSEPRVKTYDFDLNKVDGEKKALTGAEFEMYASDPTAAVPEGGTAPTAFNFIKVEGGYKKADTDDTNTVKTLEAGKINVAGFGAGTYYLLETKAPNGFNKLEKPIVITYADNGTMTVTYDGQTLDSPNDLFNVENQSGTVLPSTGGIGTTIFYVVGSILLIGAAVVLFTKKRVSRDF